MKTPLELVIMERILLETLRYTTAITSVVVTVMRNDLIAKDFVGLEDDCFGRRIVLENGFVDDCSLKARVH